MEKVVLFPLALLWEYFDLPGIPLILPIDSRRRYWETYWDHCHDEQDEYSDKKCKKDKRGQHQFGSHDYPAESAVPGAPGVWTWIGGY